MESSINLHPIKCILLFIFGTVAFSSSASVDFSKITKKDVQLYNQLDKILFDGHTEKDSTIKLNKIQNNYLVLKKYKYLPSLKELGEELRRIKSNTKSGNKIKRILSRLGSMENIYKYFVFPALMDRRLETIYKKERVSQPVKTLKSKGLLGKVLMGKIKFSKLIKNKQFEFVRVIYKKENRHKQIVLGRVNMVPRVDTLVGSSIKTWHEEIITKHELGLGQMFWGRDKSYEWELIRVSISNQKNGHFEFEILKLRKRTITEWLSYEYKSL